MNDNSAKIIGEPTRRERQAQETRTKLVEAALDLFSRQGVDSTSIKDIGREAGVAQGLLYHYFAGKDDLLIGLAFNLLWNHAARDGRLLVPSRNKDYVRSVTRQYRLGLLLNVVAFALAFVNVTACVLVVGAIAAG